MDMGEQGHQPDSQIQIILHYHVSKGTYGWTVKKLDRKKIDLLKLWA